MGFEDERFDFNEDEKHWDPPEDDKCTNGICTNCGGPSEGKTEVIEMVDGILSYFCGYPCRNDFLQDRA